MASSFPVTDRTEVKRLSERGTYDRQIVYEILDEALMCHLGFVENGSPVVIPTIHARFDDRLYLHGSPASRLLRTMKTGTDVSVAVTLIDGLVVARAPFHSSLNYRSVIVFGNATEVTDRDEKLLAFEVLTSHITPGRWDDCRQPNDQEITGTLVVRLDLNEVSAKIRAGPPQDDEEDYGLPLWAGVVPVELTFGEPVPDSALEGDVATPNYLVGYDRT